VIAKENWLSTSRRMVTVLGWERRRRYEQLFDGLEGLRRFRNIDDFDVHAALTVVGLSVTILSTSNRKRMNTFKDCGSPP
jgi:hypothetical protein